MRKLMFIEIYFIQEIIEVSKMKKEYKVKLITIYMLNSRLIIKIIIGEILIRKWKIIFRFMMEIIMPFKSINIKTKIF